MSNKEKKRLIHAHYEPYHQRIADELMLPVEVVNCLRGLYFEEGDILEKLNYLLVTKSNKSISRRSMWQEGYDFMNTAEDEDLVTCFQQLPRYNEEKTS